MHSIREIFRIGLGPSSSHTMGPEQACMYVLKKYPAAESFRATLYGSLAKTGKGHRTDNAVLRTFYPNPCEIIWDLDTPCPVHPNTMKLEALSAHGIIGTEIIYSVGGGAIRVEGQTEELKAVDVYPHNLFTEIAQYCETEGISLTDYVYRFEGDAVRTHLEAVWEQMQRTVKHGLEAEGVLPGGLNLTRRAKLIAAKARKEYNLNKKERFLVAAYAYAASEENAYGEKMVTAPTCGASGVLPAVLCHEKTLYDCEDHDIVDALAVAGLIGAIVKKNASVSGAECGCQAEIGSASAMAAAALATLHGLPMTQVESAAEIAMEHSLGLTCDPIGGLVQIPCIERNAVGAMRAMDAANLAEVSTIDRKISFDLVVRTMYETGKDLSACYRETADGGLAKLYVKDFY